jgi:hypothetical protein
MYDLVEGNGNSNHLSSGYPSFVLKSFFGLCSRVYCHGVYPPPQNTSASVLPHITRKEIIHRGLKVALDDALKITNHIQFRHLALLMLN